jgi:hypothetical protein
MYRTVASVRNPSEGNPYIQLAGLTVPMPNELLKRKFFCEQPDELDNHEFNLLLQGEDGTTFKAKSIDFDFSEEIDMTGAIPMVEVTKYVVNASISEYHTADKFYCDTEEEAKELSKKAGWYGSPGEHREERLIQDDKGNLYQPFELERKTLKK